MEGAVDHFRYFDKDGNGFIDQNEFTALHENLLIHECVPSPSGANRSCG